MKILVTGGAGYIGTHTCVELLQAGFEVVTIDNFSNSHPVAIKQVERITGKDLIFQKIDLLDKDSLNMLFSQHEFAAVIHFAGLKAVSESIAMPLRYYQNNVLGTIHLCEAMERFGVRRMVFSSSATVYGMSESVPFHEELPLHPINPYGRTKRICEELLQDLFVSNKKWGIALLRYFNPVGAHSSGLIGEDPNGIPNNLLPHITQVAIEKLPELKVFGNDYHTHDGTGVRDYIHVVDLVAGHLKALEKILSTNGVHIYNLGSGKGYSVLQLIHAMERITGKQIPYQIAERRAGDIAMSYADPSKAKAELNWTAEKTIDEMCKDTWHWQLNNPYGYKQGNEESF